MMNFFVVWRTVCILAVGSCLEVVISLLLIKSHRPDIKSHYSQYHHYNDYRPLAVTVKIICRSTVDDDDNDDVSVDDASHLDSVCIYRREDFSSIIDTISYPYNSNSSKSNTLNKFRDRNVLILGTFNMHLRNTIPYCLLMLL